VQHCEFVDGQVFHITGGALSGILGCMGNYDEPRYGAFHQKADGQVCDDLRQCRGGYCMSTNNPWSCASSCSSHADCGPGLSCRRAKLRFLLLKEVPDFTLDTGEFLWTRLCLP
jgi:hypothetical protein